MYALKQGFQALQRSFPVVAAFALVVALLDFAVTGGFHYFFGGEEESAAGAARLVVITVTNIGMATAYALLQCYFFARLGREMDRPLWKVTGGRAVREFLSLWLGLNLVDVSLVTAYLFLAPRESTQGLAMAFLLVSLAWLGVKTPLGACIMFFGRFSAETLRESLAPIARQTAEAGLVIYAGVLFYVLVYGFFLMVVVGNWWYLSFPAALIAAGVDCLLFTSAWYVCMIDRDTPDEDDDYPF